LWIYCDRLGSKQGSGGKGDLEARQDAAQEMPQAKAQWYLHRFLPEEGMAACRHKAQTSAHTNA
jgi:hypothetical protein